MTQDLYAVVGAGGCGRGLMPLARLAVQFLGVLPERLVFVDDALAGEQVNGHAVLSEADFLAADAEQRFALIAIANSRTRQAIAERLEPQGVRPWTVQAGNAIVMDDVLIGPGAALSPFVTLTSNIRIGRHFQANLYSYVEHDCVIGDFVTFAPGVHCNGNIQIHDHAYIGAGALIKQGRPGAPLVIGESAVVGMGAVVTRDVPAGATVVGNPARVVEPYN